MTIAEFCSARRTDAYQLGAAETTLNLCRCVIASTLIPNYNKLDVLAELLGVDYPIEEGETYAE